MGYENALFTTLPLEVVEANVFSVSLESTNSDEEIQYQIEKITYWSLLSRVMSHKRKMQLVKHLGR